MKKKTKWLVTHKYPNGFERFGVIYNNYPTKHDVIAYEEYSKNPKEKRKGFEKELYAYREITIDEAAMIISGLGEAIRYYAEIVKDKKL